MISTANEWSSNMMTFQKPNVTSVQNVFDDKNNFAVIVQFAFFSKENFRKVTYSLENFEDRSFPKIYTVLVCEETNICHAYSYIRIDSKPLTFFSYIHFAYAMNRSFKSTIKNTWIRSDTFHWISRVCFRD